MAKKTVAAKKRVVKIDGVGQLHVMSSFNNVIVTLANGDGQVISWSSAGKMGFRGSKKNTPYAAQMAAGDCAKVAFDLGLRKVKAYVKGPGQGRENVFHDPRFLTIHSVRKFFIECDRSIEGSSDPFPRFVDTFLPYTVRHQPVTFVSSERFLRQLQKLLSAQRIDISRIIRRQGRPPLRGAADNGIYVS